TPRHPPRTTLFPYTTLFRSSNFTLALRRIPLTLWWNWTDTTATTYELRAGARNHGLAPRESLLVAADSLWGALDEGESSEWPLRSEEHTSELQSRGHLVCRL